MALRIGRSKPDPNAVPPADVAPPVVVPVDTPRVVTRPRKRLPVAALGLGALGLTGAALAAYYFMGPKSTPEDETTAPIAMTSSPRPARPARPATRPTPAKRIVVNPRLAPLPKPGTKVFKRVTAGPTPGPVVRAAKRGRPGDAGIRPPGVRPDRAPAFKPPQPGGLPRMVPAQGAPTPIQPADGAAGQPGRMGLRNEVVVVHRTSTVPQSHLKDLWKIGAVAKQRGDYAGARRVWQEILRLSPGHPGIQEAIDKLRR